MLSNVGMEDRKSLNIPKG